MMQSGKFSLFNGKLGTYERSLGYMTKHESVDILLTSGKHLHDHIISLRGMFEII